MFEQFPNFFKHDLPAGQVRSHPPVPGRPVDHRRRSHAQQARRRRQAAEDRQDAPHGHAQAVRRQPRRVPGGHRPGDAAHRQELREGHQPLRPPPPGHL